SPWPGRGGRPNRPRGVVAQTQTFTLGRCNTLTFPPFNEAMFQIIFNELSAAEISALPKKLQLELLAQFQILPEDLDQLNSERFGVIEREGRKLYRYRAKDYRIYFAKTDEGITVHRVLHKNTFLDFLFRSKLPVSEDAQLGETREFWKLIEQGERTRKA